MRFHFNLGSFAGPFVALIVGSCFLLVGGGLFFFSGQASESAERAAGLPILSRAALEDSRPGREAIVEGRISATMQPRYQTLVAYLREYREVTRDSDGDRRIRWVIEDRVTPPLLLDTASGRVQIETDGRSSSYDFYNPPETIYDGQDLRYTGFRANDAVMALGAVARSSEGMVLDAELVHGGTQQTYIDEQRETATVLFWVSIILFGVGIFIIVLWCGIFFIWRR